MRNVILLGLMSITATLATTGAAEAQRSPKSAQAETRRDTVTMLIEASRAAARSAIGLVPADVTKREYARARRLANEALAIAVSRHDASRQVDALFQISDVVSLFGQSDSSFTFVQRAANVARAANDSSKLLDAESRLADRYDDRGNLDSARAIHQRIIAVARARGDRELLASELGDLSAIESKAKPDVSITLGRESYDLYSSLRDTAQMQTMAVVISGAAHGAAAELRKTNRIADALPYLHLAVDMQHRSGSTWTALPEDTALASAFIALGMRDSALVAYRAELAAVTQVFGRRPSPSSVVPILVDILALETGHAPPATVLADLRLLNAAQTTGMGDRVATLRGIAGIFDELKQSDSAEAYFLQAAVLARERNRTDVVWRTYVLLALRFADTQRPDSGVMFMRAAFEAYGMDVSDSVVRHASPDGPFLRAARDCRERTAMLLDMLPMLERSSHLTDTATLHTILSVTNAIDAAGPMRKLAGTGEVKLVKPDTAAASRRDALLAWAMLAAQDSSEQSRWVNALEALAAREELMAALGDPQASQSFRGIAIRGPSDPACYYTLDMSPIGPFNGGSDLIAPVDESTFELAFAVADSTVLVWLARPGPNFSTSVILEHAAIPHATLVTLAAAKDQASIAQLARVLLPPRIARALITSRRLLIAIPPEFDAVDFKSLVIPGSSASLGEGRTILTDRSLAKLAALARR